MFQKARRKKQSQLNRQRSNTTGSIVPHSLFRVKPESLRSKIPAGFERFLGTTLQGEIFGAEMADKSFESLNWTDDTGAKMMISLLPDRNRQPADENSTQRITDALLDSLDGLARQQKTDPTVPETIIVNTSDTPQGRQDAQNIIRDLLEGQEDRFESGDPEVVALPDGQIGMVFSVRKATNAPDPAVSRNLASQNDLHRNPGLFTLFGGGVNKQAYGVNDQPWVVLVAPEGKRRILESEVQQILQLREAGVDTPLLGVDPQNPDATIFAVTQDGQARIAFLEEKVDGFEIPREGKTAFEESDIRKFGEEIVDFLGTQPDIQTAQAKRQAAMKSIEKLEAYFNAENARDIPDFQVRFDRNTGRILTLDPGDPLNSENALRKHQRWIQEWKRTIGDDRFMNRIWNQKNPGNKAKPADWKIPA